MSKMISFWFLVAVIVLLAIVFFRVMASFLLPLFLSVVLVVIFNPLHKWMLRQTRGQRLVASALTTVAVLSIVLLPIGLLLTLATLEARSLLTRTSGAQVLTKLNDLRAQLGVDMPHASAIRELEIQLQSVIDRTVDATRLSADTEYLLIDLTQLERTSKRFAIELELEWPTEESIEDNTGNDTTNAWLRFVDASRRARETLSGQPHDHETMEQVNRFVASATDWFHEFKLNFFGGGFRAAVIELANPTPEELAGYSSDMVDWLRSKVIAWGGATLEFSFKFIVGLVIMIVAVYFFLYDGPNLLASIKALLPMDDNYLDELMHEFDQISRAVVVASLLTAVVQGLLAGFGYWLAGLESVFLLTLLTIMFALIPFLGTPVVWIPCCLYLYFFEGRLTAAILLGLYGLIVVSQIDNFIRPWLLHGQSKLHPLLALLSILGGITALGPIGILVGPMIVVFLQTLLKILQRELLQLDQSEDRNRAALARKTT